MGANGRWPKGKAIGLRVGTVLKVDKKGQGCTFINQRNIITFALDNIQLTKAVFDISSPFFS